MTTSKLLTIFAVALVLLAAVAFYVGVATSRNAAIKKLELAVSGCDVIQIDWIGTTRTITDAGDLANIKRVLTSQPLIPEWNYKKRLVHATILMLQDGHQLAVVHYWGNGLISIDSQLLRLENDPFPQFRPIESPQQHNNVAE